MNAPLRHSLQVKPDGRPIFARTARILRSHARHIQRLGRRAVGDIVEIGRRLRDAKRQLGHGKFLVWLLAEFGWTEQTAFNFIRVHELSKSKNFLDVPVSALHLLAAPSTPDQAHWEVAARAGEGAGLPIAEVKVIIANSRKASPPRHRIHIAKQILTEVRKLPGAAGSTEVGRIFDSHFAGLDDDSRAGVAYALSFDCSQRIARYRDEIKYLGWEIERLELLQDRIAGEGGR
jgi:hypothetical protein